MSMNYSCFGFYNNSPDCNRCPANKRCRAIFASDGMDVLEELLEELVEREADSGVPFIQQGTVAEMVGQILNRTARQAALNNNSVIDELFNDTTDILETLD